MRSNWRYYLLQHPFFGIIKITGISSLLLVPKRRSEREKGTGRDKDRYRDVKEFLLWEKKIQMKLSATFSSQVCNFPMDGQLFASFIINHMSCIHRILWRKQKRDSFQYCTLDSREWRVDCDCHVAVKSCVNHTLKLVSHKQSTHVIGTFDYVN